MGSLDLGLLFASWKPRSSALKVEAGVGMGAGFGWRGVRIQGRPNGLEFVSGWNSDLGNSGGLGFGSGVRGSDELGFRSG